MTTQHSKVIKAGREVVFGAFSDPRALEKWLVPGEMTGKIHHFDFRPGGGYEMSLYYPPSMEDRTGKTSPSEDRYTAKYVEILVPEKIVQVIRFQSGDPAFSGDMTMDISFLPTKNGTRVTIQFQNLPPGINKQDNEAGTRSSLEKLANYIQSLPL